MECAVHLKQWGNKMNSKQKIQVGLTIGLLIGIGVLQYQLSKSKKNKELDIQNDIPIDIAKSQVVVPPKKKEVTTAAPVATVKKVATVFPLKLGSTGTEVTQLQVYLLKQHGWAEVTMGTYDEPTAKRVLQFLKVNQIEESLYKQLIVKPAQLQ